MGDDAETTGDDSARAIMRMQRMQRAMARAMARSVPMSSRMLSYRMLSYRAMYGMMRNDDSADTNADDSNDDDHFNDWFSDNHHDEYDHSIEWANWFVSEPNGSGFNVFMHGDNGKWFDMDGENWTGPYVCVRDTDWIEEDIHMEEHHSGATATITAAAAMAM